MFIRIVIIIICLFIAGTGICNKDRPFLSNKEEQSCQVGYRPHNYPTYTPQLIYVLYLLSAEYSVVMCGAWPGSDLTVASSRYDILLCSETLVSDMRHVSKVLVPGFGRPVLLCRGKIPRTHGMAEYVRDGYGAFRQPKFESG